MYFNDYRLLRTVKSFVISNPKRGINPWSLRYLGLILTDKSKSVLFATFPKSGWNWTYDVIGYFLGRYFHGEYKIYYEHSARDLKAAKRAPFRWCTPADSRTSTYGNPRLRDTFPEIDVDFCLHTHGAWKESPLWGLNNAKTIFVVRNIPTALYSYYKRKNEEYKSFDECLRDGMLDRAIKFYNSWGRFTEKRYARFRIFRYEDYKTKPVGAFKDLINYAFSLNAGDDLISEALEHFSFDKEKEREYRFSNDEKRHVHYKGLANYDHLIDKGSLKYIYKRLQGELKYSFGYDYNREK